MKEQWWRWLMIPILIGAAYFRWTGIDWDQFEHYHPDERYISWVATTIEWPTDLSTALSPTQSTFNPYYWSPTAVSTGIAVPQAEHRDFAYGHLPLYLGVMATRLVERMVPAVGSAIPTSWPSARAVFNSDGLIEFDHLTAVARALTGLVDIGSVWMVFLLGKRLYGSAVGVLAAAFLAVNVMHIQLAHFFASDPYMTFFTLCAIYNLVVAVQKERGGYRRVVIAAVCIGLAVGSKFSAVLLGLPLLIALGWVTQSNKQRILAIAIAALAFVVTNPFAILDFHCDLFVPALQIGPISVPEIDAGSCYIFNVTKQSQMVGGSNRFPFTRQYAGTTPYLYFIEMQVRWGMGLLLGVLAFAGFGWAVWQGVRRVRWRNLQGKAAGMLFDHDTRAHWIVLAWVLPFWLTTGRFYVKFMRYLLPLTPFLMIYAAALLLSLRWQRVRQVALVVVLLFTTLYAISFTNMYKQEHSWVAASKWVYAEVPLGSRLLYEQWGDALPSNLTVDGEQLTRRGFRFSQDALTWLSGAGGQDNLEKLEANAQRLADGDFLIIDSNRVYGVVPRLGEQYPYSQPVYEQLFGGALGYELVHATGRNPNLAGFTLQPNFFSWPGLEAPAGFSTHFADQRTISLGRTDESFTLYDQSLVLIFENVGGYSAETILNTLTSP